MLIRTKIIIAKCIVFPIYFITMPITFIVGGVRGIVETWKVFKETDKELLKSEVTTIGVHFMASPKEEE